MPILRSRKTLAGEIRHQAIVRIKRAGRVLYEEARTFPRRSLARSWGEKLETRLARPGALLRYQAGAAATVGQVIRRYIDFVDPVKPLGRNKRYVLEKLEHDPKLSALVAAELSTEHMVEHARRRQAEGAGPATVLQDFVYLRLPLAMAKPAWGLAEISARAIEEAMPLLKQLRLVARPLVRDRRPTLEELKRLDELFHDQAGHPSTFIPMYDVVDYAIDACKREAEICRVLWVDFSAEKKTQILRDMKHPRQKIGNDFEYPLLGRALAITRRQPRVDERIFPYSEHSVGTRFTRACSRLAIIGLQFRDLRREGISRLFEQGYEIHEVAQVSGHEDLNTLWRIYTRLQAEALHRRRRPRLRVVSGVKPNALRVRDRGRRQI